jgi:hypothetical protein
MWECEQGREGSKVKIIPTGKKSGRPDRCDMSRGIVILVIRKTGKIHETGIGRLSGDSGNGTASRNRRSVPEHVNDHVRANQT